MQRSVGLSPAIVFLPLTRTVPLALVADAQNEGQGLNP